MFTSILVGRAFWLLIGFGVIFLSSSDALAQWQPGLLYTASHTATAQSTSTREPVDFLININTIANWDTLESGSESIDVSRVTTGSVNVDTPTAENPVVYFRLSKADVSKSGGGEDVLVLGRKDKLEFNADSTAMASLMGTLVFLNPTREEALSAYDLFPDHPRFDELVALYAQQKGIPSDDMYLEEAGTIAGEIVLDTMTRLR